MGPKSGWSGDRLCQTRLIPRSPDGDKNIFKAYYYTCMLDRVARDPNSKLQLNSSGNLSKSHVFPKRRRGQRQGQGNDCVSPAPEKGERCRLAPSLCWCAFHTSRPLSPRKITEKAKNWSDWLSIEFCLKQILCCLHVLHNFSAIFHLYYMKLRQHLFQISNVK